MPEKESNGKLQELIEKWGGWAALALISLVIFMYQSDRASTQATMNQLEKGIATNSRAINRLNEGKASREELKSAIESVSKDNAAFRQDFKDGMSTLRNDLVQRIDLVIDKRR